MVLKQFNDFLTFFSSIEHLKIDFLLPKVSFYQWKMVTENIKIPTDLSSGGQKLYSVNKFWQICFIK